MARKNVTDAMVVEAYMLCRPRMLNPCFYLSEITGEHRNVCYRAMERTARRGYIDYGVSLRSGFVTPEGRAFLEKTLKELEHAENETDGPVIL